MASGVLQGARDRAARTTSAIEGDEALSPYPRGTLPEGSGKPMYIRDRREAQSRPFCQSQYHAWILGSETPPLHRPGGRRRMQHGGRLPNILAPVSLVPGRPTAFLSRAVPKRNLTTSLASHHAVPGPPSCPSTAFGEVLGEIHSAAWPRIHLG